MKRAGVRLVAPAAPYVHFRGTRSVPELQVGRTESQTPKYMEPSMLPYRMLYTRINLLFPKHGRPNRTAYTSQRRKILDTVLLHFKEKSQCMAIIAWCFTFGADGLGQRLPGFQAAQAKAAGVQHVHRKWVFPRSPQETTVTQNILVVRSTSVSSNMLPSSCQVCSALGNNPSWVMVTIPALFCCLFPNCLPLSSHES